MSDRVGEARLCLLARPHWVNAWLLLPAARPYARVDGVEYPLRWGREFTLPVQVGGHLVETFFRYRGSRIDLGTGRLTLTAMPGADLCIHSRNGWANHMPLRPVLVSASAVGVRGATADSERRPPQRLSRR